MTPQKATLDSFRTLSWFVSFRRIAPKFPNILCVVTLGIYFGDCKSVFTQILHVKAWEQTRDPIRNRFSELTSPLCYPKFRIPASSEVRYRATNPDLRNLYPTTEWLQSILKTRWNFYKCGLQYKRLLELSKNVFMTSTGHFVTRITRMNKITGTQCCGSSNKNSKKPLIPTFLW